MIVLSNDSRPVFWREPMQPGEVKWFSICWRDRLPGSDIDVSEWPLPTGFSVIDTQLNVSCRVDGEVFEKCARALIRCNAPAGDYLITNKVMGTTGQIIDGQFYLKVRDFA